MTSFFWLVHKFSPMIWNTRLVHISLQIQTEAVTIFFITFRAHMNILFIIKVKVLVHVLIKWLMYGSSHLGWIFNLESRGSHLVWVTGTTCVTIQSPINMYLFGNCSWCHINHKPLKYNFPNKLRKRIE